MEYLHPLYRQYSVSQEPLSLATHELAQAEETGHDVTALRARLDGLSADPADEEASSAAMAVYDETPHHPIEGWPYFESSELDAVLAELPATAVGAAPVDEYASRVRGAWYGRIAGNMLGKPVEGAWGRARLRAYLEGIGEYPLTDYVPIPDELFTDLDAAGFIGSEIQPYGRLTRGRISGGVRDDDPDWTILNLALLEELGADFEPYDHARIWLSDLPAYQTATAEKAAYSNLMREVPIHEVGEFHNPYREWIGALIRADVFGYVFPGAPRRAAVTAYRDATLSHRANGIYGEMWAAALVSTAFTTASPIESVRASLDQIPSRSRLAEEIRAVVRDFEDGASWDDAMDALDARHVRTHWVHTVNNAGALTAAILWGDGDFTRTIALAVLAGLDTDSIGATAGSWAGAFLGYDGIPSQWLEPLEGRTTSAVFGFGDVRIDDLVERTIALEKRLGRS